MGGVRIPEDQKRVNTVNIDTDDEESSIDEYNEDSVIDEEKEPDSDEEYDDFEEITDQLKDYPDISLLPNSLYVYYFNFEVFWYHKLMPIVHVK